MDTLIRQLPDLEDFARTLCMLTEIKETDYVTMYEIDVDFGMNALVNTVWHILTKAVLEFLKRHEATEWDVELDWFGTLEAYYFAEVKAKIFKLN